MRQSQISLGAAASVLALLSSGCSSGGGSADRGSSTAGYSRPAPPRAPIVGGLSAGPYVAEAAAIDLYEVRSAELALRRSSSARVREFASMMIPAHRGTAAQLSLAGRRLNLLPSAVLMPKYQAMIEELEAAADFDAAYRRQQLAVHQQALNLHRQYAARGASPTMRPVAAALVPVVERHLRLLRYL